ncbi:MAG: AmmeMemoRadiSam system protein A [Gammaproteobacteria bacterium]|nr:AmmeMemoRadiSam system protein A [Gammaproteobacteria bacterium]
MNIQFNEQDRNTLLQLAKESIKYGLDNHEPLSVTLNNYAETLQSKRASFVTLNINHQLRGCIGSLVAHRPLAEDIAHNAYAAAFSDPRFPSLSETEFSLLEYHLSVLSESSPMSFASEEDLLQQMRPGIDGLILEDNGQRGTFLPSVWEQLPDAVSFLKHLKQKAGLPINHWSNNIKVSRYTVESIE